MDRWKSAASPGLGTLWSQHPGPVGKRMVLRPSSKGSYLNPAAKVSMVMDGMAHAPGKRAM